MKFHVYQDKSGEWRWYLQVSNGNKIANSGEGYKDKRDCLKGIDRVKECADAEVVED
jgi:uncharacterized protein YegP (UPF0339 family)